MIQEKAYQFLAKIFHLIESHNIDLQNWEIDHICYRTSSEENYQDIKIFFAQQGICLTESEVNGRQIATYKLFTPIIYKNSIIDLVEVPAPKKGKNTQEGFEHIEVVIDVDFEEMINQNPQLNFSKKGLNKDLNPELEIVFDDCAIKLHHKSLEHIINIEKNHDVTQFLKESDILSQFKKYSPCISGTIPLDIYNERSDLDIIFCATNLEEFKKEIEHSFKSYPNYTLRNGQHQNLDSLIVNFNYHNLKIELFCQNKNVFQQQANQHFLAEGRLLKILDIRSDIKKLKENGIKTEPAFGQILKLDDPYNELLEINKLSDKQILDRFQKQQL